MTNKDVNNRVEFLQAIKEEFNQFQLHYKKETEESERNYNAQKTEIESKLQQMSKEHEKEKQDNSFIKDVISMNPPKGFRIPNSNDIIDLNHAIIQTQDEFLAIDFAFQQKIPIAHTLPLATFADGTNDRCFWTSEQFGFYTAYSYRINLENKIARTRKIDKNAGYFIRCIQNN